LVPAGRIRYAPAFGLHRQLILSGGATGKIIVVDQVISDLVEDQVHQLMPAAKSAGRTPGAVLPLQFGKMMSRNQFEHVMKDCVTMSHGLKSPVCLMS
jgi:hypothetical protein